MLSRIATPFQISFLRSLDQKMPEDGGYYGNLKDLLSENVGDIPTNPYVASNQLAILSSYSYPHPNKRLTPNHMPLLWFQLSIDTFTNRVSGDFILARYRLEFENLPKDGWEAILEIEKRIGGFKRPEPL